MRFARIAGWAVLLSAPLAASLTIAGLYHYDFPYWDEWAFCPLIYVGLHGNVPAAEFFTQFHEHRPAVLKFLMVFWARLTRWDLSFEVGTSFVAVGVTVWVMIVGITRTRINGVRPRSLLGASGTALIVAWTMGLLFSPSQWENWLFGLFMHNTLVLMFSVIGLRALSETPLTWPRLTMAIVAGVLAVFTFSLGWCYWAAGSIAILWLHRRRLTMTGVWFGAAVATASAYFHGYATNAAIGHSSPGALLLPIIAMIGAPISTRLVVALPIGFVGLIGLVWMLWYLTRPGRARVEELAWIILLALFGMGAALSTAIGRVSVVQSLDLAASIKLFGENLLAHSQSRYVTYQNSFWVAFMAALIMTRRLAEQPRLRKALVATVLVVITVANGVDGTLLAKARHDEVAPGRAELLVPDIARADAAKLALVGPNPAVIRACLPAMRQDRVALFRDW